MDIYYYIFLFFTFSIIGWLIEVLYCSIDYKKIVLDRGFLLGFYLPIYGIGGLLATILLSNYKNDLLVVFVLSAVGASILEYIISYVMEKLFSARWWDYSDRKYNLNGRISLDNAFLFGVLGIVIVTLLSKYLAIFYNSFRLKEILIILSIVFIADVFASLIIMFKLKIKLDNIKQDSSHIMSKEVKKYINKHFCFIQHIKNSFPNFNFFKNNKINKLLNKDINVVNSTRKKK